MNARWDHANGYMAAFDSSSGSVSEKSATPSRGSRLGIGASICYDSQKTLEVQSLNATDIFLAETRKWTVSKIRWQDYLCVSLQMKKGYYAWGTGSEWFLHDRKLWNGLTPPDIAVWKQGAPWWKLSFKMISLKFPWLRTSNFYWDDFWFSVFLFRETFITRWKLRKDRSPRGAIRWKILDSSHECCCVTYKQNSNYILFRLISKWWTLLQTKFKI
jgi:hypothetical protein